MRLHDFTDISDSLFYKMCRDSKPPGNLKECSPWMSDFKVEFLRNELEIPGESTLGVTKLDFKENSDVYQGLLISKNRNFGFLTVTFFFLKEFKISAHLFVIR